MPALDINKLNELNYKYDILDPEVFLIHDFITKEERETIYNFAESLTEDDWKGAYLKGIEDRVEARYGDRNYEDHDIEITHEWNDKVVSIVANQEIRSIAQKMLQRLDSVFDKSSDIYFRHFGIIQRQYTGSELGGHYDQYVDDRMKYAAVCYPSDNYVDGEFYFSEKGIAIRPPAGSILVFPATEEYWHGVKKVGEGPTRYAMPTFIWNDPEAF